MLHSHGADEYEARVNSAYNAIAYEDPLEDYLPYDPIHCAVDSNTVGRFRFDITQWNAAPYPETGPHMQIVCRFQLCRAPDWIDNDVYREGHRGGLFKPREGTHINIENRALNRSDHLYKDEVAGAMGWNLGTLDPNDTVKRTVAFMFCYGGKEVTRHHLYVTQTDDVSGCFDSTDANASITYTIAYGNADPNGTGWTENNLVLIDYLPEETDRMSVQVSGGGTYDLFTNTVTWTIGTLMAGNSGQKSVTIKIDEAGSGGELINKAILRNTQNLAQYTLHTTVCEVPAGTIVYVDKFAPGVQDGLSWYSAFHDVQEGLDKANTAVDPNQVEVWAADGIYKPGTEDNDSFVIPAGVKGYGGFGGWGINETSKDQRYWKQYKTIFSGRILSFPNGFGGEIVYRNNTIVTMGNGALLDGFIIEEGADYGIYGSGVNYTVENCTVKNNQERGVHCNNGNLTIRWCEIYNNGYRGIYHEGISKSLTVENCKIHENQQDGIYTSSSTSTILNSLIYQNGSGSIYYGINLVNPPSGTTIRNNTIVQNVNEGILRSGGSVPTVKNCIVYFNNDEGTQLAGLNPGQITYCCISDCNEVNNQLNFNDVPGFVYTDTNGTPIAGNYHLEWNSPCVDSGDSAAYTSEMDIDGEERVYGDKVDIGADEVTCTETSHENDWTADGVINMAEFGIFSAAWLTHDRNDPALSDPNTWDPDDYAFEGWNPGCDLDDDYAVDLADLDIFCNPNKWLWTACWRFDLHELMTQQLMAGSGEMVLMGGRDRLMTSSVFMLAEPNMKEIPSETSIQQQIIDLQQSITFLEEIWMTDDLIRQEISEEDWQAFMNALYESFEGLQPAAEQ
jgi:hypothetical protein